MTRIFEALILNPFWIMAWIPAISIVAIVVISILKRKDIAHELKGLKPATLFILGGISIIYILFLSISFSSFRPSDEEWFDLDRARHILSGDIDSFNQSPRGIGYQLIIAAAFRIFGVSAYAASTVNIALSAITIFLAGIIAYLLSKRNDTAVGSAVIYASMPITLFFAGARMGYPATAAFMTAIVMIAGIIFASKPDVGKLVILGLSVSLISQLKPEFFIFIFPAIALVVFSVKKIKQKPIFVIVAIALIAFTFIPFATKNYQYRRNLSATNGVVGIYPTQAGQKSSLSHWIDASLQSITNSRLSASYFVKDVDSFLGFWKRNGGGLLILLAVFGYIIAARKKFSRNAAIFGASSFISIVTVYMATDVVYGEEGGRFAFSSMILIVPFAMHALSFIGDVMAKKWKDKAFHIVPWAIPAVSVVFFIFFAYPQISRARKEDEFSRSIKTLESLIGIGKFDKERSCFYTGHSNLTNFMRFNGYESHAFTDSNMMNTDYENNPEEFLRKMELPGCIGKQRYMIREDIDNQRLSDSFVEAMEFVENEYGEPDPVIVLGGSVYKLKYPAKQ